MLLRRLQVLIDDVLHERIVAAAGERGMSIGAVVREALDRGLPAPNGGRTEACARLLAAEPMDVPAVPALVTELDGLRGRRT